MISEVPWQSTLTLRRDVLRPGLPLEQSHFPCDQGPSTFHLGAHQDDKIVGVATYFPEISPLLPAKKAYRLRGMAVDPALRRSGIGRHLIIAGEKKLAALNCDLLWFNAREAAFSFYAALGYQFLGELFEIPGIGPHKVMYKRF